MLSKHLKQRYETLCCNNTLYCHKAVFLQSVIYIELTWHLTESEAIEISLLALLWKIWETEYWVTGKYQNILSAQRNSVEVCEDTRCFYSELLSANTKWPENELVLQCIIMDHRHCWLRPQDIKRMAFHLAIKFLKHWFN